MKIVAWPAVSKNPYIADLYTRIETLDPSVEVENLSVRWSWRSRSDVLHVHWPEAAVDHPSVLHAAAKGTMVAATLALHRARGSVVIWTCHNLHAHERNHPRMESWFRRFFTRQVDGVIHLSDESQRALSDGEPLAALPSTVVAHGMLKAPTADLPSKEEAQVRLGLEPGVPTLTFVGMIRRYKNVPELIKAFAEMTEPARLIVGGDPRDDELRAEVLEASDGVENLHLDDRWLTDDEVQTRVLAADVVVLPYRDVHNSGAAILAVGLDRPVVISPRGTMAMFGELVGEEWVYPLEEEISGAHLDAIVRWAGQPRSTPPSFSHFDPDTAAARTVAFYRAVSDPATSVAGSAGEEL